MNDFRISKDKYDGATPLYGPNAGPEGKDATTSGHASSGISSEMVIRSIRPRLRVAVPGYGDEPARNDSCRC